MIDTDKYEGHTKGPWDELLSAGVEDQKGWDTLLELGFNDEARLLMADAPLLLAEVKRLREQLGRYTQFVLWVEEEHNEVFDEYEGKDEL